MEKVSLSTRLTNILPNGLKEVIHIIRNLNSEKIAEATTNATSLSGLLIGVFAQPVAEGYLKKKATQKKTEKLRDFGFNIYLEASFENAEAVLHQIASELSTEIDMEKASDLIQKAFEQILSKTNTEDYILAFKTKIHPAVRFVRESYIQMMKALDVSEDAISLFENRFNAEIEHRVLEKFGDHYAEHLKNVEENWLKEVEVEFLKQLKANARIGFKEGEDLEYQLTYARWEDVDKYNKVNEDLNKSGAELKELEGNLIPVEDLIEEYFGFETPEKHNEKICFIVSDFGKGKSVFMRQYAARLANEYLSSGGSGPFPIYFNLREYGQFSSTQYGVLDDFIQIRHGIKLSDDYFKKKEYVFLVDSLDESGELTRRNINEVIESVKNIQRIDPVKSFRNKLIITSRPFDEGLKNHLTGHKPYFSVEKEDKREIYQFISIYGFKKSQFNDYLIHNIKASPNFEEIKATGFAKKVFDAIKKGKPVDIHGQLLEDKTLSITELRRPIFAYTIFQLLLNNVDFRAIGKIGVYLSFLNLLTKEAKHIESKEIEVNLKEEFRFRNILHSTAALWMYERQSGNQGILNKADICRAIKGEIISEDDRQVLEQFTEVNEIQFFSHSYFGQEGNNLHFQHQSFAEILLAEYYLKIFIKYALDEEDLEEARIKLMLGEPTQQTMDFLKDLIGALKDSMSDKSSKDILEKRRLLFPFLASAATKEHNRIFCNDLYYRWFKQLDIKEGLRQIPDVMLKRWPIGPEEIDKIINLCIGIIESPKELIPVPTTPKSSLFKQEVSVILVNDKFPPDMDKWLALFMGNTLVTDLEEKVFFNSKIENHKNLFDLIKNWNSFSNESCPSPWGFNLFMGINMSKSSKTDPFFFKDRICSGLDFSYSFLKYISFRGSNLNGTKFQYCKFENVDFQLSVLSFSDFRYSRVAENAAIQFALSIISQGVFYPYELCEYLFRTQQKKFPREILVNFSDGKARLNNSLPMWEMEYNVAQLVYIIAVPINCMHEQGKLEKSAITDCFIFNDENLSKRFDKALDKYIAELGK